MGKRKTKDDYKAYLVNAAAHILAGQQWEDHHAAYQIQDVLHCPLEVAAELLALAMHRFPGVKVTLTRNYQQLIAAPSRKDVTHDRTD